ncbi:Uncharacterised protein [Pseudomonas aeruginosa]|nr:Uncharacterised protein [Pseudomonas aeruginosa]
MTHAWPNWPPPWACNSTGRTPTDGRSGSTRRSSAACWKHSAIRRRVRNRSNRAWPRWPGCARTAPTSDCWSANAASRWSKRSAPPAPRASWSTRTARGSPCAWMPKAACRRRPAAAMRSCRWSSGNGRWRWRRRAVRPWPASPRVARVAGVWPPRSMPCAAPATAAWATAPPSRTCCAAPRGMAPTRWRSARCTPWPRPTDMPTAPTRRPAGCSSMSCTPRRRPFSARRRWNRRSVAPAWPRRWPAWRAWS